MKETYKVLIQFFGENKFHEYMHGLEEDAAVIVGMAMLRTNPEIIDVKIVKEPTLADILRKIL
ncbi:hypothetical protein GRU80_000045 [Salmonella enterica]|uniref:Uncharacterized protein n=1 Tax=Salmonella enterica TaxID=28901 RepID=A0A5Z4TSE9_SALER|nr:hypothetical protein [Salmonella enterica]EAA8868498.1 hypothetical protein [Salmonella enterica subsp. enterica serovar Choleraesuis]ECC3491900.1 hypothetical protein [Salmonella enterica subsp. enterica serovar 4,[5],12:i:-]ECI4635305.1 hypothetical protein [Salmonella enterica subsp. enterica]ECK8627878.1 hypothetical protein [Salmonella enterica subsp. enterica serovar Typhimurium]ECS6950494.1 hypothetical protein [Salmonella enterica subsp. enterica serovar Litchfield]ECU8400765.1 hyp